MVFLFGDPLENTAWAVGRLAKVFGGNQEDVNRKMRDLFNLKNSATNQEKLFIVVRRIRRQLARATTLHYSYKECILFHWAYSKSPSGQCLPSNS
uniref:Uncharacterized protein n=1 Tax=Syphacia muris TaxID=451379 RepID=A0A0N5AW78_9BILA